jgi:hypothetical protein
LGCNRHPDDAADYRGLRMSAGIRAGVDIATGATMTTLFSRTHRAIKPGMIPLTDPAEIESVRSNLWDEIHGFEVAGVVYGYAYSVERWRKVHREPRNETGEQR